MATAIICIIIIMIVAFTIRKYIRELLHGCCGAGDSGEKKIKPSDKNISHYPFTFNVNIEGMTCSHCKMRVENGFNEIDGLYVVVNLKEENAVIRSKHLISEQELKNIVSKNGYRALSVKKVV